MGNTFTQIAAYIDAKRKRRNIDLGLGAAGRSLNGMITFIHLLCLNPYDFLI